MSCTQSESLTAYVDHELSPTQEQQLANHLATCEDCRATLTLLQTTTSRLAQLPALEPSIGLRRRVLNCFSVERQSHGLLARWRTLWMLPVFRRVTVSVAGGAAAAILALGVTHHAGRGTMLEVAELGREPGGIELAANFEVVRDLDVLGMERPEDLDVIEHLDELERTP